MLSYPRIMYIKC